MQQEQHAAKTFLACLARRHHNSIQKKRCV